MATLPVRLERGSNVMFLFSSLSSRSPTRFLGRKKVTTTTFFHDDERKNFCLFLSFTSLLVLQNCAREL